MVYTLTCSPSIDYYIETNSLNLGTTNRAFANNYKIGGKGINVSRVLAKIGVETTALGFIGGFTGKEIKNSCEKEFNCKFITTSQNSRINIKLLYDNMQTEINTENSAVKDFEIEKMYEMLKNVKENDFLVISGSLPSNFPENFYENCIKFSNTENVIVDTSGKALVNILKCSPLLVKPNRQELTEISGVEINSYSTAITYGQELVNKGAKNVLVSLDVDGSVFISPKQIVRKAALKGNFRNSVGAGDTMVAGYIFGLLQRPDDCLFAFKKANDIVNMEFNR
jgi:1-phosphofructokinase